MTSYRLDEWLWAMFEPNFTFSQLCMWIVANNEWPDMTSYGLYEWLWEMSEPTWTLPNSTFGHLFMWIGANNDQIWLPMG